jgi:hypothetical protein
MKEQTTTTILDAVIASIRAAAVFNKDDVEPPVAILWPDEKREWERLLPRLRLAMPHLLTFGAYDATARAGPAIWLRCVLAGKISDVSPSTDAVPILYLPGVSRPTLRATDECPPDLQPLVELLVPGGLPKADLLEPGRLDRPAAQRHRRRRTGGREGSHDRPHARLVSEAVIRPLGRHGDEGQCPVLQRRAGGVDQGDRRLNRLEFGVFRSEGSRNGVSNPGGIPRNCLEAWLRAHNGHEFRDKTKRLQPQFNDTAPANAMGGSETARRSATTLAFVSRAEYNRPSVK